MFKLYNTPTNKTKRKTLRKNQTTPEQKFWHTVRNKQLGVKFRRQQGVGNFIVDFYCKELKLVVEIDGNSHFSPEEINKDKKRESFLKAVGLDILRFTNEEVMQNLEGVLFALNKKIKQAKD